MFLYKRAPSLARAYEPGLAAARSAELGYLMYNSSVFWKQYQLKLTAAKKEYAFR